MKRIIYFTAVISLLALFSILSCKKDDNGNSNGNNKKLPVLTTNEVTDVQYSSAKSGGVITDDGGSTITQRGVCWSTGQNPTVSDNKSTDGTGAGSFTSSITGLEPENTYYVRAYATNANGTGYGSAMSFTTIADPFSWNPCPGIPIVTDIDGNTYNTLIINGQCWLKENLKTTHYRNGAPIPYVADFNAWSNLTYGAFAWYDIDISWKDKYGALYNWHAVNNTNGLCPTGWHVPSDADWTQLVDYVVAQGFLFEHDDPNGAGNALRSCQQIDSPLGGECNTEEHPRWDSHNTHHGFDEFGFSGLPGGDRSSVNGGFYGIGEVGYWWSSTEIDTNYVRCISLHNNSGIVWHYYVSYKTHGVSVRCIKD